MDSLASSPSQSRPFPWLALLLVGVIGIFYLATLREGHVWGDDHAAYLSHARNLVEGRPYGDIGFVRAQGSINPKMYPPVFPLLLAPFYQMGGGALTPLKVECVLFFCVSLFLLYFLLRPRGEAPALLAVALTGFSPYFWDFKDTLYSDYPFLVFAYAALLVGRGAASADSGARSLGLGIVAGLLSGLATGTRSVGLILIPVLLVCDWLRHRRVRGFAWGVMLSFVGYAWLQQRLFSLESDYLTPYREIATVHSLLASPWYYVRCFAVLWENGHSSVLQYGVYTLFAVLALWGGWRSLRREFGVVEVFTIAYFLFICLFPWGGKRYLMPIMPMLFFYAFLGALALFGRLSPSLRPAAWAGLASLVLLTYGARFQAHQWREIPGGIQSRPAVELLAYLRRDPEVTGPLVFLKARFLAHQLSGRVMDLVVRGSEEQALRAYLDFAPSHLIVSTIFDRDEEKAFAELIRRHPELFEKRFDNGAFLVYKRLVR